MNDSRIATSIAAINIASKALLVDKHSAAAPSKVILKVMNKLFAPAVFKLIEDFKANSQIDTENHGVVDTVDLPTMNSGISSNSTIGLLVESSDEHIQALQEVLCGLCKLFLLQLKRFINKTIYGDSFDKLWFQLLHILGLLLHEPKETDVISTPTPSTTPIKASNEESIAPANIHHNKNQTKINIKHKIQHVAFDQLKNLLTVTVVSGVFQSKQALWTLTCDYIRTQYHYCPNIVNELFAANS